MRQLKNLNFSGDNGAECGVIRDEEREKYRPAVYQMLDGAIKTLIEAYDEMGLSVEEHRLKVRVTCRYLPGNLDARLLAPHVFASTPVSIS
jgi:hypothetical protein